MKRIIALFTLVFIALPHILIPAQALETQIQTQQADEINTRINALYDLRSTLLFDYANNIAQIEKIDAELASLGVRDITYEEVMSKFNSDISPMVVVPNRQYVKWTEQNNNKQLWKDVRNSSYYCTVRYYPESKRPFVSL